jgi:hypothetical protein
MMTYKRMVKYTEMLLVRCELVFDKYADLISDKDIVELHYINLCAELTDVLLDNDGQLKTTSELEKLHELEKVTCRIEKLEENLNRIILKKEIENHNRKAK